MTLDTTAEWPAVKVDLDKIRKERSLMIATPAYGGQMHVNCALSVWGLETLLMHYGIAHNHIVTFNDPYVSFARNRLTQLFLESEYTDLLFIDADVEFNPADVLGLMHFDKDVIGGSYPRKEIDWVAVKRIVQESPEIDPYDLEVAAGVFTTGSIAETMQPMVPTKTLELATGFMLIKRSTFERTAPFCQRYKAMDLDRVTKSVGQSATGVTGDWITDFFPSGVVGDLWVGDDFQFCRKVAQAGLDTYVCGWMQIAHHGTHRFPGNMHMAWQYRHRREIELATQRCISRAVEVEGWMAVEELLYLAAAAQKSGTIIEVGSFMGRSTCALAQNTPGQVIAVDTWAGSPNEGFAGHASKSLRDSVVEMGGPDWLYEQFTRNTAGLPVRPVKAESLVAVERLRADGVLADMIFIDASHDYASAKADILAWSLLLKPGGILCGHDYGPAWDGVRRAVKELVPEFRVVGTIWTTEKTG